MASVSIDTIKQTITDGPIEYINKIRQILNGGPGSGNFDHAGRPGEVGGSAPGGGISLKVINGVNEGFARIHETDTIEHALVLSSEGQIIGTFTGDEHQVKLPKNVNLEDAHLVHNHPEIYAKLSPDDVNAAIKKNMASISATSPKGIMTIFRPEGGWPNLSKEEINLEFDTNLNELYVRIDQALLERTVSRDEVDSGMRDVVMESLDRLGLRYHYVKR